MEFDKNKNIILVCYPRSGSTVTYQIIKQNLPNYISLFEFLNLGTEVIEDQKTHIPICINHHDGKMYKLLKTYEDKYKEFLRREKLLNNLPGRPFMLKFFGDFIMRCPDFAKRLLKNENNQFIFLNRKNIFKSVASYLVGFKTKKWSLSLEENNNNKNKNFMFLPDDRILVNGCLQRIVIFDILKLHLQDRTILNLSYEDNIEQSINDFEILARDMFNPNENIKHALFQKQNFDHESLIINSDELKQYINDFFDSLDNGVPAKRFLPEWWNPNVNLSTFLLD
jgi:hypothetical protein